MLSGQKIGLLVVCVIAIMDGFLSLVQLFVRSCGYKCHRPAFILWPMIFLGIYGAVCFSSYMLAKGGAKAKLWKLITLITVSTAAFMAMADMAQILNMSTKTNASESGAVGWNKPNSAGSVKKAELWDSRSSTFVDGALHMPYQPCLVGPCTGIIEPWKPVREVANVAGARKGDVEYAGAKVLEANSSPRTMCYCITQYDQAATLAVVHFIFWLGAVYVVFSWKQEDEDDGESDSKPAFVDDEEAPLVTGADAAAPAAAEAV